MRGPRTGTREREFAKRLDQALSNHPRAPRAHGRISWLVRELAHENVEISFECARKWLAGDTMPRRLRIAALAKTLQVDEIWLAMGEQPVSSRITSDRLKILEDALRHIRDITDNDEIRRISSDALITRRD